MSSYEFATFGQVGAATAWLPSAPGFRVILDRMDPGDVVALDRSLDGGATWREVRRFADHDVAGLRIEEPDESAWHRLRCVAINEARNIDARLTKES